MTFKLEYKCCDLLQGLTTRSNPVPCCRFTLYQKRYVLSIGHLHIIVTGGLRGPGEHAWRRRGGGGGQGIGDGSHVARGHGHGDRDRDKRTGSTCARSGSKEDRFGGKETRCRVRIYLQESLSRCLPHAKTPPTCPRTTLHVCHGQGQGRDSY